MSTTTLSSIFDSHKEELSKKLENYSLPRDSREVQSTVAEYLSNMFENDGDYRQSLTQSEDYILQSAIQLLQAQQNIAMEIASMASSLNANPKQVSVDNSPTNPYISLAGTGIGAIAGSFMGTWGAVCGAIAGTAVAVYISTGKKKADPVKEATAIRKINVNAFINIVKMICGSIDDLMETYRVQVKRIQHSYEQREDMSLLNTYSALVDQVANVIRVVDTHENEVNPKVRNAVELLKESLENYDLKYENGKIVNDR